MNCFHCADPILAGEKLINARVLTLDDKPMPTHVECFIRIIYGSAAHQLRDCPCFGGAREEPEGLTKRQCATLALSAFRAMSGQPEAIEVYQ